MVKFKLPTAYTTLFLLIVIMAVLTWVIPAGKYNMKENAELGQQVPVAGTYHQVPANPQGFVDVMMAPIHGFYKGGQAEAIDVALFVLVIGGFLGIVTKTGAIDAGIESVMIALKGREQWMIPILMLLFAAGGTIYGMAEESIPFYVMLIPVFIAAGYDSIVGVAVIMLGAGIGTMGSTINPFATVVASNAAMVPFTDGILLRVFLLIIGWLLCVFWVMRYAAKVKANPKSSLVADMYEDNKKHFLGSKSLETIPFTGLRKLIMLIFAATFAVMIYGVSVLGWYMTEISALFLGGSILVGLIARMKEEEFTSTFVDGARDLLGVALVIGIARGIVVIMNAGLITDTLLYHAEQAVSGLSSVAFINVVYWIQVGLSFLVPSSSGLAVLTMPILAPLADFSHVSRELVVTAFQSASGVVNLINPTFAVVVGGLAVGRINFGIWLRFTMPLILILCLLIMGSLSFAALM